MKRKSEETDDNIMNEISFEENEIICNACKCNLTQSKNNQHLFSHLLGKKHKKNAEKIINKTVYIFAIGLTKDDISNYFSNFGEILSLNILSANLNIYCINFETNLIDKINKQGIHIINNTVIKVSTNLENILSKKIDIDPFSSLINIKHISGVKNQLQFLVNNYCVNENEEYLLDIIYRQLINIAYSIDDHGDVFVYGSRVFEFPLKNSDIDFTFNFTSNHSQDLTIYDIRKLPEFRQLFQKSFIIPSVNYPILKVFIDSLNITGDISINNFQALRNNLLLSKYFQLAHKFESDKFNIFNSLILILKIWRSKNKISGDINLHINSYGWIIMIIYYLQKINYFPPLQNYYYLKSKINNFSYSDINDYTYNGWDCSFYTNIDAIPSPKNIPDIKTSLIGFFNFYLNEFDYDKYVVDIREGGHNSVTRQECIDELFCHPNILSTEKINKHFNMPVVIQDPFELSHNIAKNLDINPFNYILDVMKLTYNSLMLSCDSKESKNGNIDSSIFDVFFPDDGKSKIYKSKIMLFKSPLLKFVYSKIRTIVYSLFEMICVEYKSDINIKSNKLKLETCHLLYEDIDKTIFKENNIEILKDLVFHTKTKEDSWLHKRKNKRKKEAFVENQPGGFCEYEFLFRYLSENSFEIRFNNLNLDRENIFNNLFALLKKKTKEKYNDDNTLVIK